MQDLFVIVGIDEFIKCVDRFRASGSVCDEAPRVLYDRQQEQPCHHRYGRSECRGTVAV